MQITILGSSNGIGLTPVNPPLMAKLTVNGLGFSDQSARIIYLMTPQGVAMGAGTLTYDSELGKHVGILSTFTTEAHDYIESVGLLRPLGILQVATANEDGTVTPDFVLPVRCSVAFGQATPAPTPSPAYITQGMFADLNERLVAADSLKSCKDIINEMLNILQGVTP